MVDMSKRPKVVGDNAVDQTCDDCFFALLFVLQMCGVFATGTYWLIHHDGHEDLHALGSSVASKASDATLSTGATVEAALYSALFGLGGTISFLFVFFQLMESCAFALIVLLNALVPLCCLGGAGVLVHLAMASATSIEDADLHYLLAAAALAVFALLQVMWLCCIWGRIAMTAGILSNVANVLGEMPGVLGVNYASAFVLAAWWAACGCAFQGVPPLLEEYAPERPNGVDTGCYIALTLCLYWGHETIRNVAHVTTCGTIGSWYFFPHVLTQGVACCRPATCDSLRRAVTTSFGSIAFGSLLLAIIDTIHAIVRKIFDQLPQDNAAIQCVRCCVECFLGCLKSMMEWLTEYAFVYIAIYGISFVEAGREVKELVMEAGFEAVVQQTLIEGVLLLGKLLGALAGAGIAYAGMAAVGGGALGADAPLEVVLVVGAVAGLVAAASGLTVVDSGCKTLLVCFAEEPDVMRERKAGLAEQIEAASRLARDKNSSSDDTGDGGYGRGPSVQV